MSKKITKDKRVYTQRASRNTMLRIAEGDLSLWISAAARRGLSRAEFMRQALRDAAVRALSDNDSK